MFKKEEPVRSNLKKIKDCKMRLSVEVSGELVEQRFGDVFREIQKVATLPGFRKGKAPQELIEKNFSKEAEEEVLKSLVPEVYTRALVSCKAAAVTLPTITELKLERGRKMSFFADFEKAPEFTLKNYKGMRLRRVSQEVSDEDLEKGMRSLQDARAELTSLTEPRPVEKGDFLVCDIEIWREDRYEPGRKGALLYVEPNPADDFFDRVLGAWPNEVREITHLKESRPHYKVWIRDIQQKKLPPVDNVLAKSFGRETPEELKEAVRRDIAQHKRSEARHQMRGELFQKLLEASPFKCPEGLVNKQAEKLLEDAAKERPRAELSQDQLRRRAEEQVRLYFILRRVADEQKIEADEAELERRLNTLAEESKRPIEEARRVFEDDIREGMREQQTIEFLLANAKFDEAT